MSVALRSCASKTLFNASGCDDMDGGARSNDLVVTEDFACADGGEGMVKPAAAAEQTVKLSFGKRKANAAAVPHNAVEAANTGAVPAAAQQTKVMVEAPKAPAGVGFVDFSDDLDMDYDEDGYDDDMYIPSKEELLADESIDPDTLLTEEDRKRPIIIREFTSRHECRLLLIHSRSRSMQAERQEAASLQGLFMRSQTENRRGGRCKTSDRRPEPANYEAGSGRSYRGRLHSTRQSGKLWQLRTWRCIPVRWMSLYRLTCFQAGRRS